MKLIALTLPAIFLSALCAQDPPRQIPLPTSKVLNAPSPGRIGAVNSFPATIALSPDGQYAALLNNGYGTQQTQAHQSITILDLTTNQLTDFPDARLSDTAHQSYFLGLAFSSDGRTSVRVDGFDHRPHGREARQYRQRHRGLQI